jgi:hypothetical protein
MNTPTQAEARSIDRRSRRFAKTFVRRMRSIVSALPATALLAGTPLAHGATHYVANNGTESTFCGFQVIGGFTCGAKASPCRSISCAIREADPGDVIIVGPGRYGDLNFDGDLGDEGEEFGSPGCACMVSVNKSVSVVSSHGAAATMIDARTLFLNQNVLLILDGGEFGGPGKGFTVTGTRANDLENGFGNAITVDSNDVKIRGNQIVTPPPPGTFLGAAISTVDGPGTVLIEGNQVLDRWSAGIHTQGSNKTVRRNHVSGSSIGIESSVGSPTIVGNLVTGNFTGINVVGDGGVVTGNAAYGNNVGIEVRHNSSDPGLFRLQSNNLFGNSGCGIEVHTSGPVVATNNYWGASTGPGGDPADELCDDDGTTTAAPFATKPFSIDPPLRP